MTMQSWRVYRHSRGEFFYLNQFDNLDELEAGTKDYIRYYNHDRIKPELQVMSPVREAEQVGSHIGQGNHHLGRHRHVDRTQLASCACVD